MPLVIFVPLTLNVKLLPSSTLDAAGDKLYVGAGVVLLSLIVIVLLVASTVPLMLPERISTLNVSDPSVVKSGFIDTENEPLLLVIVNDPLTATKSDEFDELL